MEIILRIFFLKDGKRMCAGLVVYKSYAERVKKLINAKDYV